MGPKDYITAIEIGSSEVSGTVGITTYEGIKIIAYASEPVEGFISKGVVRNVDAASHCISNIINRLESQLNGVTIEKAYITIGGLSVHSIKSTVKREFDEYKKITSDIIESMAAENDKEFIVPEGYQKVQGVIQEYRLDDGTNVAPTGFHTRSIVGNYLNIVIKEQYMKQLTESFDMARVEIVDSFCAAKIDADILLSKDDKRNCALINMGAETTTISIYSNDILRKLVVLPIGGENITKDICAENISREEAEQLKIFKGYNSNGGIDNSPVNTETLNKIIGARVGEILLNVKHQIEEGDNRVAQILFTGGGAKLKNLSRLIEEYLPSYSTRIITEPSLNCFSDDSLHLANGAITPTLFGLLSTGKENCCREPQAKEPVAPVQTTLWGNEEEEEQQPIQPAEPEKKAEKEETKEPKKPKNTKKPAWGNLFDNLLNKGRDFVSGIIEEEEDGHDDDN